MCAILHDKYQWLAPGCRLLLTGSHCLSGFTQMETILSQHSHKNQSGLFSFFLLSLPFSLCADSGGAFLLQRVGDNTFICLQGSLRGLTSHFTSFCNFTQTWVSLAGTVVMQCVKTIITQRAGFTFFCFVLPTLTWHDRIPAVVTGSYLPFGLGYEGALCFSWCASGWVS